MQVQSSKIILYFSENDVFKKINKDMYNINIGPISHIGRLLRECFIVTNKNIV